MILEMGLDHRDQVKRNCYIADGGDRLWLAHDIALTTNTDATAYRQNARLQIDVLAAQLAYLPKPQSTERCQRNRKGESGRHGLDERLDLVQRGWGRRGRSRRPGSRLNRMRAFSPSRKPAGISPRESRSRSEPGKPYVS